jgi:hypothetical protein
MKPARPVSERLRIYRIDCRNLETVMPINNDFDMELEAVEGPTEVMDTIPRAAWTVVAVVIAAGSAAWAFSVFHMAF